MAKAAIIALLIGFCATLGSAGLIDRGQDLADVAKYPLITGFFRIEMNVVRLDTQGKSHTGLPCDIFDKCDPKIIAFIDTEKPNNDFGGDSVPYSNYITLVDANNTPDVVEIDKTISRDVCGKGVRKIAMRVRAIDKDGLNDDKIDNYKCHITGERNPPAENEKVAQWSPEIACAGEDRASSKVYLRYRWYNIPESTCRPSSNGQGLFSGLFSR
ncbi:hypothetical protein RvY_00338 [Ramazzottius varieornatus]|uniref:Uncharacterized protein n=1 Tax=Ramazzottius varieornatus TaxID=947166 RepID=A0A1D1UCW7_RAMVA|nr:hypothetical protein RvY_00338 [Ramazzottius varieornatus]